MAGPITWRNVDAPSNRDVMTGFAIAGNSFNNAGDAFGKILAERQAANQTAVNAENEMAKQAYLDLVATAKTPEAIAALEASGRLEQLRVGMTAGNLAATRGATEARTAGVRQNISAEQDFNLKQQDLLDQPTKDAIVRVAITDPARAKVMMDGAIAANPAMRNTAALAGDVQKNEQTLKTIGRADRKDAEDQVDRANTLQMRPYANNATIRSDRIGQLNLNEAEQKAVDTVTDRAFTAELAQVSGARQANQAKLQSDIGREAKALGMPMNSDGTVDTLSLTSEKRKSLNAVLESKGLAPVEALERGDTAAMEEFFRAKMAEGKLRPDQIESKREAAMKAFDTTGTARIGNDKEQANIKKAQKDAIQRETEFRVGVPATKENLAGMTEVIDEAVNRVAKPGTYRHEDYTRQIAKFLNEGGYKMKDPVTGKETRFVPNKEELALLLKEVDTTNFLGMDFTSAYGNDIKKVLDRWVKNKETPEAAANAMTSVQRGTSENVLRNYSRGSGVLTD